MEEIKLETIETKTERHHICLSRRLLAKLATTKDLRPSDWRVLALLWSSLDGETPHLMILSDIAKILNITPSMVSTSIQKLAAVGAIEAKKKAGRLFINLKKTTAEPQLAREEGTT